MNTSVTPHQPSFITCVPSESIVTLADLPTNQDELNARLAIFDIPKNFAEDTVFTKEYAEHVDLSMMFIRRLGIHVRGVVCSEMSDKFPHPATPLMRGATPLEISSFFSKAVEGVFEAYEDKRLICAATIISCATRAVIATHSCVSLMGLKNETKDGKKLLRFRIAEAVTPLDGYNYAMAASWQQTISSAYAPDNRSIQDYVVSCQEVLESVFKTVLPYRDRPWVELPVVQA